MANGMTDKFGMLARTDPRQIIEALFFIENKDAQIVPFRFNGVQMDFYKNVYIRALKGEYRALIDILKARQQGFSSLILALYTVDFLAIPNMWCVCVSHEREATKRLFRKVHLYIERLPFAVPLDMSRADMLVNKLNGSVFYIGTAGSRAFGQGDTIHRLHLSEVARYQNPELLVKNIMPAVPKDGFIIKESTANGANNYHHRQWMEEKKPSGIFVPFFSGWNRTLEYSIDPPVKLVLTPVEQKLEASYGLTVSQINWRRQEILRLGSESSFMEQYPINELEAFISTGDSAFDKESLM